MKELTLSQALTSELERIDRMIAYYSQRLGKDSHADSHLVKLTEMRVKLLVSEYNDHLKAYSEIYSHTTKLVNTILGLLETKPGKTQGSLESFKRDLTCALLEYEKLHDSHRLFDSLINRVLYKYAFRYVAGDNELPIESNADIKRLIENLPADNELREQYSTLSTSDLAKEYKQNIE